MSSLTSKRHPIRSFRFSLLTPFTHRRESWRNGRACGMLELGLWLGNKNTTARGMRKAGMNMSSPAAARLSRYSEREEHCAIKLSSSPFVTLLFSRTTRVLYAWKNATKCIYWIINKYFSMSIIEFTIKEKYQVIDLKSRMLSIHKFYRKRDHWAMPSTPRFNLSCWKLHC